MGSTRRGTIAVTGASGLVGRALCPRLREAGWTVRRMVRGTATTPDEIAWNPAAGRLEASALAGVDAVVHLAGENLSAGRWTPRRKEEILRSRVGGTSLLARTLAALPRPPRVLVSASAIGWYGDRGDALLDEGSSAGTGFLAEVCARWEEATEPARAAGIRVVVLRTGVVLCAEGGALPRMAQPFRMLVGGRVGSGRQWVSWIARDDVVGAIAHLLDADGVGGAVNLVAPGAATNAELSRAIGRALHRPSWLPAPAFALRLAFGEMSQVVLGGARVAPKRLLDSGYVFRHPTLDSALQAELGHRPS